MSTQTVKFVLDRLFKDPRLFHDFMASPYQTLGAFDLSPEETEAIISGNRQQLIAIGIDERVAGWVLHPRGYPTGPQGTIL